MCPSAGPLFELFLNDYSPVDFIYTGLIGFQSHMFWGLVSQVQVLKVRVSNVGFKFFVSLGEALGFEFLSIMNHYTKDRNFAEIVFQLCLLTFMCFISPLSAV